MSSALKNSRIVRCSCGSVELEAVGPPILSVICYCDDCQEGAHQIEALPGTSPLQQTDGGTACVLYRKDRLNYTKGASLLQSYKINENSATSRVVATCCNAAMIMKFDDSRHWIPVYQRRFQGDAPPVQMRICTKFKPGNGVVQGDVPSYPGYPLKMMGKLAVAWIPMLLHR
jgi:hypothetical protein